MRVRLSLGIALVLSLLWPTIARAQCSGMFIVWYDDAGEHYQYTENCNVTAPTPTFPITLNWPPFPDIGYVNPQPVPSPYYNLREMGACGGPNSPDERDAIIIEYWVRNLNPSPTCNEIVYGAPNTFHFSFSDLTVNNWHTMAYFQGGNGGAPGIEYTQQGVGYPLHITSGWRCPDKNRQVGGVFTSLHQWGRAFDVVPMGQSGPLDSATWTYITNACWAAGASSVEPYDRDPSHAHCEF